LTLMEQKRVDETCQQHRQHRYRPMKTIYSFSLAASLVFLSSTGFAQTKDHLISQSEHHSGSLDTEMMSLGGVLENPDLQEVVSDPHDLAALIGGENGLIAVVIITALADAETVDSRLGEDSNSLHTAASNANTFHARGEGDEYVSDEQNKNDSSNDYNTTLELIAIIAIVAFEDGPEAAYATLREIGFSDSEAYHMVLEVLPLIGGARRYL